MSEPVEPAAVYPIQFSGAAHSPARFFHSLTFRNLVIFIGIFFISLAPLAYSYREDTKDSRINMLAARLDLIAEQSVKLFDDPLLFIFDPNFTETAAYSDTVASLNQIQTEFEIDNAILITRDEDGKFAYLADGNNQFLPGEPMALHGNFPETYLAAKNAWNMMGAPHTELFGLGTYDYLQINKPILFDGKVAALLLLNKFAEDVDQAIRLDTIRLGTITLLLALSGVSVFWFLSTRMLAPLLKLRAAAQQMAQGNLDLQIKPLKGKDEVAHLNESFRMMVTELRDSREALHRNNEALKRALARVQLMEDLEKNMSKFLPNTVERTLRSDPQALERGKISKDVSVLFLDVEGSTLLTETMRTEEIARLIESYFSEYLDHIYENKGDINETAGDGLMIIFQDDEDSRQHARNAVKTALEIQKATRLITQRETQGNSPLKINIGVGSGPALVGFTKFEAISGTRMTFSASGMTTILASRLQDKATGGQIFVSEETFKRITANGQDQEKLACAIESIGKQHLKNIVRPEEVYAIRLLEG